MLSNTLSVNQAESIAAPGSGIVYNIVNTKKE